MSGTAELIGTRGGAVPPEPERRRVPRWPAVVLVVGLVLAAAAFASARTSAARFAEQASVFADIAVTKTFDELSRQSLLPPDQRDVVDLESVLATPQSDQGGIVWTTDVRQSDLRGSSLDVQVVVSAATATGESLYAFEFVQKVTPPRDAGSTPEVVVCAVRTSPDTTSRATGDVFYTDHMVMPACTDSDLLWLGPGT
jgi:hypothetical protein